MGGQEWRWSRSDRADAAWSAGIRHFDVAPHYGLGLAERDGFRVSELRDPPRVAVDVR